jgi:16S rRNA (uracil1498-N3)-methyltransferase
MRLHRFYIGEEIGDHKALRLTDESLVHQLRNVFRMTVGGQFILFDNSGFEYQVMIVSFDKNEVQASVISQHEVETPHVRELHLFCSLIKKDKFEWVLEKGTELGVTQFIPLISDRSEKKSFNVARAEKIITEASEQSGRARLPVIAPVTSFDEALTSDFPCFAFHPEGAVFTIEHTHTFSPLGVFIGPEGGWTDREVFLFRKHDIKVSSLGPQILRAETAALAISSLILLQ